MYRLTAHAKSCGMGDDLCQNVIMDLERDMKAWRLGTLSEPCSCTDTVQLKTWVDHVLHEARTHLHTLGHILHENDAGDVYMENNLTRLSFMHKHFVITTVDKAGNNVCIVCKKHYIDSCM